MEAQKRDDLKKWILLILIVFFLILMIFTIVQLIKEKDLISTDALTYGMKENNFTSCTCYTENRVINIYNPDLENVTRRYFTSPRED